jgi:poly(hydroxyalkanoate) depolymerase family esterase
MSITSPTTSPTRRRTGPRLLAAVTLAVAAAVAAVVTPATPAGAAGLAQVTGFGSNPGNLLMYAYVPGNLPQGAPLVVALHGCTQTTADYYTGAGWTKFADSTPFAVVYPQQQSTNNSSQCFNWFQPGDTGRDQGEAASIRQMVDYAIAHYGSDTHRVYVTGLSAGGAMTAALLAAYPDRFAGGAIMSGIPAGCATTLTEAYACMSGSRNRTPAQWGDLVRQADPGWSGPWPRVAVWHGTADYTVATVNATESGDQWTDVWGLSQTPTSTTTIGGNTTESVYATAGGTAAVATFLVQGMGHGTAVRPGTGTDQCGATGAYFLDYVCSSYHTAVFWGLISGSGGGGGGRGGGSACFTATNYAHVTAGRAHDVLGYAYADGSDQAMGLDNLFVTHTLERTGTGYYVLADSGCP